MSGYFIDVDSSDAFLDAPDIKYESGRTAAEILASEGYDLSPGAERLVDQLNRRRRAAGLVEIPPLPPINLD